MDACNNYRRHTASEMMPTAAYERLLVELTATKEDHHRAA
jgi:hypothetical protein